MSDTDDTVTRANAIDWRHHGVKVIPGTALDPNTAQTPGMKRMAAINHARTGAEKLWAGTVDEIEALVSSSPKAFVTGPLADHSV